KEFAALYEAYRQDLPSPLSKLPIQYADFANWQREWLQGDVLEAQLSYWRGQLGGEMPVLQLPTDRPRPPVQTHNGAVQRFVLGHELAQELQAFSRKQGATLFMTLLGAFQALLARFTGQEDIAVGSPIAGRNQQETEALIGLFVNTLVMRTDLSGDPTFAELIGRVREVALGAYAHQDVPFEKLVEELQPVRDMSRTPLFQVLFVLQNAPMSAQELPGLTLAPVEFDAHLAKFDLEVALVEEADGIVGTLNYNTDLFDETTISRMMQHFQTLLEAAVHAPQLRVSELPLMTETEEQVLLTKWEGAQHDKAYGDCIHHLFEAQVEKTPDATAIVFEDTRLTYRELNQRANQVAHYLQKVGVGPDALVTLCVERSAELVVGLLGILKAGAAYVPLDTSYPEERIALILEDSEASVLVTQSHLLAKLPTTAVSTASAEQVVVCLDRDAEQIAQESCENPTSDVEAHHLAYMIYTSGSTGKPKAVMVEHGNLASTLLASQQHFDFQATDVMPWIASVAFDIALFELMNPLLCGGTTVVLAREHVLDLPRLVADLKQYTAIHTVPSLMRQIVQTIRELNLPSADYDNLRLMFTGGDAVPPDLVEDMNHMFHQADVHVLYGPTEGTIICSHYLVPRGENIRRLLIGQTLCNANLRIYDAHQNLVPLGVPGELYIGGAGVSRGYYRREELTAEKFVVINGARWYRTGDLVRRLPDGTLEFLGRIDNQVKIRGFRIELGEIETVLADHANVREAVVIVQETGTGDKRLIAYVVPEADDVTSSMLREALKEKLPEYMVPSVFMLLDALPLNPNGKVDRRALPTPDLSQMERSEYIAPRTAAEETVATIWADVL
ncbi:MAG: non-ribosomal peptide synthetase, partial [Tumebacillaceae bacterium]